MRSPRCHPQPARPRRACPAAELPQSCWVSVGVPEGVWQGPCPNVVSQGKRAPGGCHVGSAGSEFLKSLRTWTSQLGRITVHDGMAVACGMGAWLQVPHGAHVLHVFAASHQRDPASCPLDRDRPLASPCLYPTQPCVFHAQSFTHTDPISQPSASMSCLHRRTPCTNTSRSKTGDGPGGGGD